MSLDVSPWKLPWRLRSKRAETPNEILQRTNSIIRFGFSCRKQLIQDMHSTGMPAFSEQSNDCIHIRVSNNGDFSLCSGGCSYDVAASGHGSRLRASRRRLANSRRAAYLSQHQVSVIPTSSECGGMVASAEQCLIRVRRVAVPPCLHYLMRRYLGLGYNVVTGNPFTNGADPGFAPESRQQMLKLTYTEGRQCVGVLLGGFTAALRALERPLLVW